MPQHATRYTALMKSIQRMSKRPQQNCQSQKKLIEYGAMNYSERKQIEKWTPFVSLLLVTYAIKSFYERVSITTTSSN